MRLGGAYNGLFGSGLVTRQKTKQVPAVTCGPSRILFTLKN
jgi:hypothetical protein